MKDATRHKIWQHWQTVKIGTLAVPEQLRILRAQIKDNPELSDLLLLQGMASVRPKWSFEFRPAPDAKTCEERNRQRAAFHVQQEEDQRNEDAMIEKVKAFDRIVEMLDHQRVGAKLLGDCTKADLLRAAVSAEQKAGEMTLHAGFYRLLADLVPQGKTVRQAGDRGKIVALLTHTFKEEANA